MSGRRKTERASCFRFLSNCGASLTRNRRLPTTLKQARGFIARHVFCYTIGTKAGQGVTEGGYNKAWRKARVAAGCPGRIPHDFRRTAVRNLVRAGVPERVAMQMTGHKTRAVFERYNIVSEGDLRDAALRLDRFASSPTS